MSREVSRGSEAGNRQKRLASTPVSAEVGENSPQMPLFRSKSRSGGHRVSSTQTVPHPRDTSISLYTRSVARSVAPVCCRDRAAAGWYSLASLLNNAAPKRPASFAARSTLPAFASSWSSQSWRWRSNSLAALGRNPRRHYPYLTIETVDQLCQLPLERITWARACETVTSLTLAVG